MKSTVNYKRYVLELTVTNSEPELLENLLKHITSYFNGKLSFRECLECKVCNEVNDDVLPVSFDEEFLEEHPEYTAVCSRCYCNLIEG